MKTIQAITSILETVFAQSAESQQKKATKRTVIRRSAGQIMTEKSVIEQVAEQQSKTGTKRPSRKSSHVAKPMEE